MASVRTLTPCLKGLVRSPASAGVRARARVVSARHRVSTCRRTIAPCASSGRSFVNSFDGGSLSTGTGSFDCNLDQMGETCTFADVQVENDAACKFSKISIQVENTPGLLRLITWVLTGLDVHVQTAEIRTDEHTGVALHTFFVLNAWGEKLRKPDMMEARLTDFLSHCRVDDSTLQARDVFQEGRVRIEMHAHPTCTRFTVGASGVAESKKLLDTVSVICGLGLVIVEADLVETGRDSKQWSMLLRSAQGKKLDCFEAAALLFVMAYVFPMSMCGTPLFEQA